MRSVWKYPLEMKAEPQVIEIPYDSGYFNWRHVDFQGEQLCVWVEVDTEAKVHPYSFQVFGTGWEIPDLPRLGWLGTASLRGYVWHVFVESPL